MKKKLLTILLVVSVMLLASGQSVFAWRVSTQRLSELLGDINALLDELLAHDGQLTSVEETYVPGENATITDTITVTLQNYWEEEVEDENCPLGKKDKAGKPCKPLIQRHYVIDVDEQWVCENGGYQQNNICMGESDCDCTYETCDANYLLEDDYNRDQCGNYPTSQCLEDARLARNYGEKIEIKSGKVYTFADRWGATRTAAACTLETCYKRCVAKTCAELPVKTENAKYGLYSKYFRNYDTCYHATMCDNRCPDPSCSAFSDTKLNKLSYCQQCNTDSNYRGSINGRANVYQGGYYRCYGGSGDEYKPAAYVPSSPDSGSCHIGVGDDQTRCCEIKTCAQIDPNFPDEYGDKNQTDFVFREDDAGNAGKTRGGRCGKYTPVHQAWWTVNHGNVYARVEMKNNIQTPSGQPPRYVVRAGDNSRAGGTSRQAGLPMLGQASGVSASSHLFAGYDYRTQHTGGRATAAYPAFVVSDRQRQDFAYFRSLINYDDDTMVPNCSTGTHEIDGVPVCKIRDDGTNPRGVLAPRVGADESLVVFVEGNLRIENEVKVDTNHFKAFIVSGTINVSADLGREVTAARADSAGPTANDAVLQGMYIADQIVFLPSASLHDDFNVDARCDQQLIAAGSFVDWGTGANHDLALTRTFKGCTLLYPDDPSLADANADLPAQLFFYRPDLALHTPNWMKSVSTLRLETT